MRDFTPSWWAGLSPRPGWYFGMLLDEYFEGLGSVRVLAWPVADSMSARAFLKYVPEQVVADRSTLL